MRAETLTWTIIQDIGQYGSYPCERTPPELRQVFVDAYDGKCALGPSVRKVVKPLGTALECYLQVTGLPLGPSPAPQGAFEHIAEGLIGAIYSGRFFSGAKIRRYEYVRALLKILSAASLITAQRAASLRPRPFCTTPEIERLVVDFEQRELIDFKVHMWSGWVVRNALGKSYWLPFRPIFEKLGREWTASLHETIGTWYAGSRSDKIPALREFALFIGSVPNLTATSLRDPIYMGRFWRDFWIYYKSERGKTARSHLLVRDWTEVWRPFANTVLTGSGLVARSAFEFPGPGHGQNGHVISHRRTNPDDLGILLVAVPAKLTDDHALNLLLKQIPESLSRIKEWAATASRQLYERYRARKLIARHGEFRVIGENYANNGGRWLTSRENPRHLSNAAATYERFGHASLRDNDRLAIMYPKPAAQTAFELGLPVATSLLAHAALLVIEHPEITSSFLENLHLFDKQGKLTGLRRLDGGYYLIGYKFRKGRPTAEQRVKLTRHSRRVVIEIFAITRCLRDYLRTKGDDNWRRLFLTCGPGFGYPKPVRRFATDTSMPERVAKLRTALQLQNGLTDSEAEALAARFSLKSLRATAGISVFIKTHSEEAAALALGHEEFSPRLLGRYLPPTILSFFRARWVRAFQLNLIAITTEGTPHLLRATGFQSTAELDEFLLNNCFPGLRMALTEVPELEASPDAHGVGEFILEVNHENLTMLSAVSKLAASAPNSSDGVLTYWAEFSQHLFEFLEARRGADPRVDACLDSVERPARPKGAS